jgi:membrane protein
MWTAGRTAKKILKQPGAFALAVIKQFRANQGVLLAGAVAYYTLLSLVPLLILILMALSHIVAEDRLLLTLSEYLEFVVPGQSAALVQEVRTFLAQKQVIGGILFVTMLFFSALAFTILENAMSVIFYHRVKIKRRHFLVSAVMPYLFILFLGVGASDRHRSFRSAPIRGDSEHRGARPDAVTGSDLDLSALYSRRYR